MFVQLDNCIMLKAVCRDPPAVTSAILRSLGLNNYDIRSFWYTAKRKVRDKSYTLTVFRHRDVSFKVELEVRTGSSCFTPPTSFIDRFDCQELQSTKLITNLNMLYVYVKGYIDDELFIKVNGVYLLRKLVDLGEGNTVHSIRIITKKLLSKSFKFNDLVHVNNLVNTMLRFNQELRELIIYVPKSSADFLRLIPLLISGVQNV